jgi:hypothetical protein
MVDIVVNPIEEAMTKAIETVIGAVAAGAASAAQAAQSTAGAQGTVGGAASEAGLSTQAVSGEVNNKIDVSAPEIIESLNVHALKDAALANKTLVAQFEAREATNSKLYDVTATALGLATLGTTHNMTLQQQMASDHRDQNHNKQINIDEQVIAVAALYARLVERLNNPTPPAL